MAENLPADVEKFKLKVGESEISVGYTWNWFHKCSNEIVKISAGDCGEKLENCA